MKAKILGLVSAALLAASTMAQALTITGDWTGTFQDTFNAGSGLNNGTMDLQIQTQTQSLKVGGSGLTGQANLMCTNTADPTCGSQGFIPLSGVFDGVQTLSLNSPVGPSGSISFFGRLLAGNSEIAGTYVFFSPLLDPVTGKPPIEIEGNFDVVATPVPEPTTLMLFGLGIAGLGFMRRRKTG
jgi:hypothetical protein